MSIPFVASKTGLQPTLPIQTLTTTLAANLPLQHSKLGEAQLVEAYFKMVLGESSAAVSGALRQWIKSTLKLAKEACDATVLRQRLNPKTLNEYLGNDNAFLILCRGYQLAQVLAANRLGKEKLAATEAANLFASSLEQLKLGSLTSLLPEMLDKLTFNPQTVHAEFHDQLVKAARWELAKRVVLASAGLFSAGVLAYKLYDACNFEASGHTLKNNFQESIIPYGQCPATNVTDTNPFTSVLNYVKNSPTSGYDASTKIPTLTSANTGFSSTAETNLGFDSNPSPGIDSDSSVTLWQIVRSYWDEYAMPQTLVTGIVGFLGLKQIVKICLSKNDILVSDQKSYQPAPSIPPKQSPQVALIKSSKEEDKIEHTEEKKKLTIDQTEISEGKQGELNPSEKPQEEPPTSTSPKKAVQKSFLARASEQLSGLREEFTSRSDADEVELMTGHIVPINYNSITYQEMRKKIKALTPTQMNEWMTALADFSTFGYLWKREHFENYTDQDAKSALELVTLSEKHSFQDILLKLREAISILGFGDQQSPDVFESSALTVHKCLKGIMLIFKELITQANFFEETKVHADGLKNFDTSSFDLFLKIAQLDSDSDIGQPDSQASAVERILRLNKRVQLLKSEVGDLFDILTANKKVLLAKVLINCMQLGKSKFEISSYSKEGKTIFYQHPLRAILLEFLAPCFIPPSRKITTKEEQVISILAEIIENSGILLPICTEVLQQSDKAEKTNTTSSNALTSTSLVIENGG